MSEPLLCAVLVGASVLPFLLHRHRELVERASMTPWSQHLGNIDVEDGHILHYDQWGRVLLSYKPFGYWVVKQYDPPRPDGSISVAPISIIHKYSTLYTSKP